MRFADSWPTHKSYQPRIEEIARKVSVSPRVSNAVDVEAFTRLVIELVLSRLRRRLRASIVMLQSVPVPRRELSSLDPLAQSAFANTIIELLGPDFRFARQADERYRVVAFDDEAHQLADYLSRCVKDAEAPWFHREFALARLTLRSVVKHRSDLLIPTLARLANSAMLVTVLAMHETSAVEEVAAELNRVGGPGVLFAHPLGAAHPPAAAILRYIRRRCIDII